jgi:hypothetical protein
MVHAMTNPSVVQQLGKERGREILEASMAAGPGWLDGKVRERIGWSLIGLGVHLALDRRTPRAPTERSWARS